MLAKKIIIFLPFYFGRIVGKILPVRISLIFRRLYNYYYSGKISSYIKSSEGRFFVEYPFIIHGGDYICVGDNFECRANCRIEAYDFHNGNRYKPSLNIGNNVAMNFDCHIACLNQINIGNGVLLASRVFITDHFHGDSSFESLQIPPGKRVLESKGPVVIGDNVWIGEGVVIMPNVQIGENSIIGANSVVTKSFPKNSVIAGVPAKLIKSYNE